MPLLRDSTYRPPGWLKGGHAQTIFPSLFRKVAPVTTLNDRLELDDGDFVDLAWSGRTRNRLAILSHGLEGSSRAPYVQGMAAALVAAGWDALAWSFRGCGGEANRLPSFYHSGATADLDAVIRHAIARHPAKRVDLIGFSLGGNLTLKYLGETRPRPEKLGKSVVFSVPCDLADSSAKLASRANAVYMARFMRSLRKKIRDKSGRFPGHIDAAGLESIRTFHAFDDRFTAPLHGFTDAVDYWKRSSSISYLSGVGIPALLVNAANDPFLGEKCYPAAEAAASGSFHLEVPEEGGHVGFRDSNGYWSERRAIGFLED